MTNESAYETPGKRSAQSATTWRVSAKPRRPKEDPLLHDALFFQFVVIGEAVKNLASETRQSAPEIPWTDIAGLRDLIAPEYFRIDMHRVLEIVEKDLPPLEHAIDRVLDR